LGAGDQLALSAGHDITLNAVTDRRTQTTQGYQGKTLVSTGQYDETLRGTSIDAFNGVAITAGNNLTSVAGTITSANGDAVLMAGHDINLNAGYESHAWQQDGTRKTSGFLSTAKTVTHDASQNSIAAGSLLSGNNVSVMAGNDITTTAASLAATDDVTLAAQGNIVLLAGQQLTQSEENKHQSGGLSGSKWSDVKALQVTNIGTSVQAGGDVTIVNDGAQVYQAANIQSGGDTTLVSGGGIAFLTATDIDEQSRTSGKHNIAWQASDNSGHIDTAEKQSNFTTGGDLNVATTGNVLVQYGQQNGETQDQAIARMTEASPGMNWMSTLQNDPYVTWNAVGEQHDAWHEHHEGMTPALGAIVTAVAAYFTAGAASALIGSAAGAAAGSGTAFAAAGASATTGAAVSAGWANATLAGVAAGSVGGAAGAVAQGNDWRTPALYGGITGGLTGYLTAGTYYNNPANGAKQLGGYIVNGEVENIGEFALTYATTNAMGQVEAKLANKLGMNGDQLNWLLMAGSIVGNVATGTRYESPSTKSTKDFDQTSYTGVRGYLNRGPAGLPFDTIDLLLGFQGLPDASTASVLYNRDSIGINQPVAQNLTCHSLGTVTCSYLGRNGLVNGDIYLASVPFTVVAPPNANILLGNGDAVNGFSGGALFNWNATVVPIQFLKGHPFENYKKYVDEMGAKK
ncbi:hemagglutinin repeat-containing protein, partial [Dyella flava]